MIHWMLFSVLATGLLYGLYCLTFRRDRWLQVSRWYLIVALIFSLLYPLVRLPEMSLPLDRTVVYPSAFVVLGTDSPYVGEELNDVATAVTERSWWPQVVYLTGMGITLIILLVQTIALAIRLRRLPTVRRDGVRLALLDDDTSPCSFFDYIIIGTRAMSDEELQCVLAHESEHVRRHHTEDVLLVRLLCCVAWFNPFAWLMLSELRAVHEYQADAVVNAQRSTLKTYLCLLYRQVTGTGYGHITNNFQSINIKKRIVMMNKTKTRFGAWKVLAALPVAALLLMVGCKPATPTDTPEEDSVVAAEQVDDSMTLWDSVEVDPEFPDGMEGLYKYLSENIHYPEQAKTDGIEGRVIVNFVIEADGSVSNAKVLRGIGGGCDEEALRVVEAMPKWTPGKMQDKPVRVQFYLPVVFKLGA